MEVPHGFKKGVVRALGLVAAAANNPFFLFSFFYTTPTPVYPPECVPQLGVSQRLVNCAAPWGCAMGGVRLGPTSW